MTTKERIQTFESKPPEIVFEWHDTETDAIGWTVINSLRGGAAGGGTRMRLGLDKYEVQSLAKTMEVKFTVSGPEIGGAKSGINFDPKDPRKEGVLKRWYAAVYPILKNYYGTGGDLNIDEVHEVIPITERLGLWHPQEGIVNGHFHADKHNRIDKISRLRTGVSRRIKDNRYTPDPELKFLVADMITGYGVSEAVRHYYNNFSDSVFGKRVLVQGWGNVASAAAYYLAMQGAKVVGILDKDFGIIEPQGIDHEQVKQLFLNKKGNALNAPNAISAAELATDFWNLKADIFIPGAASRLVNQNQISSLIANGLQVVSCGANVPFADREIFFGPISQYVDEHCSLIPDFVANCGMARVFAYLMLNHDEITDESIFQDVSEVIGKAIFNIFETNGNQKTKLTASAFDNAISKLI